LAREPTKETSMQQLLSQPRPIKPASRRLSQAALLLAISAVVHLGVLLATGGSW
jgi:hypothetical protein